LPGRCISPVVAEGTTRQLPSRTKREQLCQYVLGNPFSVEKITLESPNDIIIYRSKLYPKINRNFEVLDPVDFLAVLSQHLSD